MKVGVTPSKFHEFESGIDAFPGFAKVCAFLSKSKLKTFAQASALKSRAVAYTEACRT